MENLKNELEFYTDQMKACLSHLNGSRHELSPNDLDPYLRKFYDREVRVCLDRLFYIIAAVEEVLAKAEGDYEEVQEDSCEREPETLNKVTS